MKLFYLTARDGVLLLFAFILYMFLLTSLDGCSSQKTEVVPNTVNRWVVYSTQHVYDSTNAYAFYEVYGQCNITGLHFFFVDSIGKYKVNDTLMFILKK